jgi:xanthine dehydrogenase accessory factor
MNRTVHDVARQWLATGRTAVVLEVLDFKGSVPRETGTRMLVATDSVVGTIGGGHLELQAIEQARTMLAAAGARAVEPHERDIALGPSLGQCCGGVLRLRSQLLSADALAAWPVPGPRLHLQMYGAGHVGRAIARLLADIDCSVQWIDERDSEFPAATSPPHIERLCVEPVEAEVKGAPRGTYFLVLTHSHELDLRISEAILRRGDFAYFGLIGSATKRARFVHRFEERGIARDVLARMTCPIGMPGIVGKEPEVIAVAVVAQLLAVSSARARVTADARSLSR